MKPNWVNVYFDRTSRTYKAELRTKECAIVFTKSYAMKEDAETMMQDWCMAFGIDIKHCKQMQKQAKSNQKPKNVNSSDAKE